MQNNFSKCREWVPRGTSQHKWRWLTTLLMILTLATGQMWGAVTVQTGNAGSTAGNSVNLTSSAGTLSDGTTARRLIVMSAGASYSNTDIQNSTGIDVLYGNTANSSTRMGSTSNLGPKLESGNKGHVQVKVETGDSVVIYWFHSSSFSNKTMTVSKVDPSDNTKGVKVVDVTGINLGTSKRTGCTGWKSTINDTAYFSFNTTLYVYAVKVIPAPAKPTISGDTEYTESATISLTATCSSGADASTTYTWYKGATWNAATKVQNAATAANGGNVFTKTAALDDSGVYWCEASNGGTLKSHNETGKSISVTASSASKYDITYNNIKGAANTNPVQYTEGIGVASFAALADVDGFHFTGWNPSSIASDASGDKTINAQWVPTYNVSFDKGAGSGSAPAGFPKWEGATFNLPGQGDMTAPEGRVFGGWKVGVSDKYTAGDTYTMGTTSVEFIAQWDVLVEQVLYSWEGAEGGATEVGGIVTGSAENLINQESAGYYCLKIDGNNSYSGNLVTITLSGEEKVKTGDKIKYWGFYNKSSNANARPKMRDANSPNAQIFDDGTNLPNLNGGGDPAVRTFTVPAGINTNAVQLTRSLTGSNTWIPKIQIIREKAVPEEDLRTVTFNTNGGSSIAAVSVEKGTAVAKPADPTRAHYRFAGWQLSGSDYNFSSAVNSNITLDAVWTQLYTVTYAKGAEDATGTAPTQDELAADEKFIVAANPFTYAGHDFSAWNDGTNNFDPGMEYTMGSANVTLTAQWITATTKATVTYKDGETDLATEDVTLGNAPTAATYTALQTKNLATFDGWYSDPDLAEIHKIADMTAVTISEATTFYAKWNYQYAQSANLEQWVLTNGTSYDAVAQLGTLHYASNIANSLDSLNDDPSKDNRNYAYLGLKIKASGKMLDFRLANGQTVKVKLGATGNYPQVALNGGDYAAMSLTDNVWTYTAEGADAYISIKTANNNTVVIKQIMINEDIAAVTLPWRVTFDANGGTCATEEAIWSGSALILPDVTPAEPADYTFAGWYDEEIGGELKGVAGASYTPTGNETLFAHFAPVEYAVNYAAGEHGSGSMAAVNVGWGTEYTAVANAFTPETGYIFAGWAVTGVDGVSTIPALGSFTMPKNPVTLTAQWEDNSKVAVVVETSAKYETLAAAIAAAEAGQTIQLLQNIEQTNGVAIAKNLTLDLNGKTFTCTSGSNVNYRAIKITAGNVTIQNGSIIAVPTANFEGGAYGPIRIEGASTNVTLEDLTLQNGRHYGLGIKLVEGTLRMEDCTVISENGGGGLEVGEATADVINCTFTQTGLDNAHAWISTCLATCDNGVLNVQGGTYTSEHYSMYVYTSGGEMNVESGNFTGDMVNQVTLSSYPDAVGAINISGGSFEGVGDEPIHFTTDNTGKTTIAISGGTFDAPVANEYCAPGYVPAPEVTPGVYTVMPKDGVEIIGVVVTGNTTGTVSGLYQGTATVNLNSKKIDSGKYIYVTLKEGYTFEENDVLIVDVNAKSNLDGGTKALEITTGVGNIDGDVWKSIAFDDYTTGENIISLEGIADGQTSIGLKRSANQNAKINGLRVLRPMKPMLTAITIDGRDGVINEANKTVAVQIPYESNLAALTVVPTIVWNEAAATNSIVVNDGSAWIEGANTYKLTDKDGDYTVYTITLTRDVQKHTVSFNTHGGSAVASVEVEDGGQLAAAPAAPEKEDYLFQGWAETADGAVVDVTSFTISAAKEFHAVWAAETGVIKLFDGEGNLNTTNFVSAPKNDDPIEIASVEYPCLAQFASNRTSLGGAVPADMVKYDATTDEAKIKMTFYNLNSSVKKAILYKYEEGAEEPVKIEIEVPGQEIYTTDFYEFNSAKNRSFYVCAADRSNIRVLQVKVVDNGANPVKQFGQIGYSLNLNKGRLYAKDGVEKSFEGLTLTASSEYKVYNNSNLATKAANSFNVPAKAVMHVERSGGKYYVYQDPEDKGTLYSANADIELNATGTWYLSSETTSSAASFTLIRFDLPKCAKPTVADLADVDYCQGDAIDALTVSATVSDGGTMLYQWYKDGVKIDGAEEATYQPTADGEYYVVVVNTLADHQNSDATQSNTIAVTGHAGTVISGTTGAEDWPGEEVTISVTASGKNLSYAWFTCDDAQGTNPVAVSPAVNAAELNVTVANADSYYKVVVSGDCGEAQEAVITVVARQTVALQDVTGNMTWDFSKANDGSAATSSLCTEAIFANVDGINNNDDFESDNLMVTANKFASGKLQASMIKFHTTVDGMIKVVFSNTGSKSEDRYLTVNGRKTDKGSKNQTAVIYTGFVYAGDVVLGVVEGDGNMLNFTSVEFKATVDYPRTVNPSFLGTLCWTNNAVLGGATLYEFAGKNEYNYLVFDEVAENRLEAGKPYIFMPENGNTEIKVYNTDNEDALTEDQDPVNNMYGTITGKTLVPGQDDNMYYFSSNHIWAVKDFAVNIPVPAYYCYVDYQAVLAGEPAAAQAPGRRRVTMGVNGQNTATGVENLNSSEKPVKLLINGQIFILRGDKLFDATGRLVK